MRSKRRSRLGVALDRAHRALGECDRDREPRAMRALVALEHRATQPAALEALYDPLVQVRSRGLRGTVDPTIFALADRRSAVVEVGRELSRTSLLTLVLRLRQRGDRLRAAMVDDRPQEEDDDA